MAGTALISCKIKVVCTNAVLVPMKSGFRALFSFLGVVQRIGDRFGRFTTSDILPSVRSLVVGWFFGWFTLPYN